jgi:hypothetical protein
MTDEITKELGKIKNVKFGHVGYNDAGLGIQFELGGESWGVCDTKWTWDYNLIKRDSHTRWTEEEREKLHIEMLKFISNLLRDAKVDSIEKLKGKPIEVTFRGFNTLDSWRILSEVL